MHRQPPSHGQLRWPQTRGSGGGESLATGACTSPALANLVSRSLDRRIQGYTTKAGWVYSRYADDLVFSSKEEEASPHRLIRGISSLITDEGFVVNEDKTRVMRAPNRQTVTGLLVNRDVGLDPQGYTADPRIPTQVQHPGS